MRRWRVRVVCATPSRGVASVGQYRLYFIDRFSGHIETSREFLAEDDDAARAQAVALQNGQAMELWSRDRKVGRWEAERPPGS